MSPIELENFVPANMRMQVIQHLRSHLNIGSIKADMVEYMITTGFTVTAFATKYEFEIKIVIEDSGVATSSLLDLGDVKPQAPTRKEIIYSAEVSEILEPGDQFPRFEASFINQNPSV